MRFGSIHHFQNVRLDNWRRSHSRWQKRSSQGVPHRRHCPARRYVTESAVYAWGLTSPGEVLAVVRLQRDAMMTQLPLTAIETCLKSRPTSHRQALEHVLQSIADIDALTLALQSLDDFTYTIARCLDMLLDFLSFEILVRGPTLESRSCASVFSVG